MTSNVLSDFLFRCGCCKYCVLRYLKPNYNEFLDVDESLRKRDVFSSTNEFNEFMEKRHKFNPCCLCFGIFELVDEIVLKVRRNDRLKDYEINKFLTSFCLPVILELTQLQMWLALLERYPEEFNKEHAPDISIKDAIKHIVNQRLEKELNKKLDVDELMISINFSIENESEILNKLDIVAPDLMIERNKQKKRIRTEVISRNYFLKHFTPKTINVERFRKLIPIPPQTPTSFIQLDSNITLTGPTIFLAGRYNKYSRQLSQTPWLVNGIRMSEGSVEEIIVRSVLPYFKVSSSNVTFMASGREDVDVRCLGRGRPFALEISDSTKEVLETSYKVEIERQINQSGIVSIRDLQIVSRDDLHHIKSGEETKKKYYRALCTLRDYFVTPNILERLNINEPFELQQLTPLRVLHRRTLMSRARTVYSVKSFAVRDKPNLIILDIVTQAGTYVKELVHGEFGRTKPSISSFINMDVDIIALDVMNIELDFPPQTTIS